MKKLTTKESTKAKKGYKKDLEACNNINELQWIYIDFADDMTLTCDDLLELMRYFDVLKAQFIVKGDRYSGARRPAFRR